MKLHTIFYLARENDNKIYRFPERPIAAKDFYGPQKWLNLTREHDSLMEDLFGDQIRGGTIMEIHACYENTTIAKS